MTTYYIDGVNGNNGNPGTISSPKLNFDGLTPSAGDTFVLANDIRSASSPGGSVFNYTGINDLKFLQWRAANKGRASFRADIVVTTWSKTAGKTNIYEATPGTSLGLQSAPNNTSVMVGAGLRLDDWERHACCLQIQTFTVDLATTLTALDSATWGFYYDNGTGKLYVNLGGAVPTDAKGVNQITYTKSGINTFVLTNCARTFFDGIRGLWANDGTAGTGYGGSLRGCTYTLFRDCHFIGWGYHPLGFIAADNNNRCEFCTFEGSCNSGSTFVYYSDTGDVDNCVCYMCTFKPYPRIKPDGTPHNITSSILATITHTNAAGPLVVDMTYDHCLVRNYPDCGPGLGSFTTDQGKVPTDPWDASTYGAKAIDCVILGGVSMVFSDHFAHVRPRYDFSNSSVSKSSWATNGIDGNGGGVIKIAKAGTGGCEALFDSGYVIARLDTDAGTKGERIFAYPTIPASGNANFRWKNMDIWENGAPLANRVSAIIALDNNASAKTYVYAIQSIIGWTSTRTDAAGQYYRLCTNDANTPADRRVFTDCAYYHFDVAAGTLIYSANTAISTQVLWFSVVDPNGLVLTTYPFQQGGQAFVPELESTFQSTKKNVTGHTAIGLNLAAYSRNYGAVQYGLDAVLADPATISGGNRVLGFGF